MKRESLIAIATLALLILTITIEGLVPTQTTILDPLKELVSELPRIPFKFAHPWSILVYSEHKSLMDIGNRPLKLVLLAEGCAVEISESKELAYEVKAYTSPWSANWKVKTDLMEVDDVNVLFIRVVGVSVILRLNPRIMTAINVTGSGFMLKANLEDLNRTSFSIEVSGATVTLDLKYNEVFMTNLTIRVKGGVVKGDIQVPKETAIYAEATSYSSLVKINVITNDFKTLKILTGRSSVGEPGGLHILVYSESSTVSLNAKW